MEGRGRGGGLYRYKLGQSCDYYRGKRRRIGEEMWQCFGYPKSKVVILSLEKPTNY